MRILRTHSFSLLAMLLLLLGTAAPALVRMTCVVGGHTVLNVGQPAECCPEDHAHATTEVKATCCEMLQAQPQRANFVQGAVPMVPVLFAMVLPDAVLPVQAEVPSLHGEAHFSLPPPLPRMRRLAAFGTFLI